MSIFQDQKRFMTAGGQVVCEPSCEQFKLYTSLVDEEYNELMLAITEGGQKAEVIKEAIDLIVVTSGLLVSMGVDAEKAWDIVHENNMMKTQNVTYHADGKIKKSEKSKQAKNEMMNKLQDLLESK